MEKVGFIGAYDKTNIIMYTAKLLKFLNYNVLVVDGTILQKMRYIAPSIIPTKSYITNIEGIDFAIGFENIIDINRYLGIEEEELPYDYVLFDIESVKAMESFEIEEAETNYFVTGFDMFSLRKGLSILGKIRNPIKLTKVLCRQNIGEDDEDYLNYLSSDYRVIWNDYSIYIPNNNDDTQAIEDNQRLGKLRIKKLSGGYQEGLIYIAQQITGNKNLTLIRKAIKE